MTASLKASNWYFTGRAYACAPAKCGSTSLARSRIKLCGQPRDDGRPRYLAVRDPVERFISLCRQVRKGGELKALQKATPEQIMDAIETSDNRHWRPLVDHLVPGAIPVPLPLFFAVLGLPNVRANVGDEKVEIVPPSGTLKRLARFYAEDVVLYRRACERWGYGNSAPSEN